MTISAATQLLPLQAGAATITPQQAGESWATLNALQACIKAGGGSYVDTSSIFLGMGDKHDQISHDHMNSGVWWENDLTAPPSFLVSGVNTTGTPGQLSCNSILQAAVPALGIKANGSESAYQVLYCELGGATSGHSCSYTGSDGHFDGFSNNEDAAAKKLLSLESSTLYGGKTPSADSNAMYQIYLAAFNTMCHPTASSSPAPDYAYTVYAVQGTGNNATAVQETFEGAQHSTSMYAFTGNDLNRWAKSTCQSVASHLTRAAAQSYATWLKQHPDQSNSTTIGTQGQSGQDPTGTNTTSCNLTGGLGWILCPVMTTMASIVDGVYGIIAGMLTVQPISQGGASTPIYQAWSIMRNIANVMFAIFFMIIIYSQLTGVGITNYGLKRLLPKLIIAAILVNVSYWICAIAVDISNILGVSLKNLFDALTTQLHTANAQYAASLSANSSTKWYDYVTGVIAAAALAWAAVAMALSALIICIVTVVVIFVVLTIRQALIILLIVVSPLAFVAYLLPNTEPWFQKWRKLFQDLLLMYPIVAILFGASAFASNILASSASSNYAMQAMALAVSIMPLALLPLLMKSAGSVLGSIGNKIQGHTAKSVNTGADKAKEKYKQSALGQWRGYRQEQGKIRRAQAQGGHYRGWNPLRKAQSGIMRSINDSSLSGKFGDRLSSQGAALIDKDWDEAVGNQQKLMSHVSLPPSELLKIVQNEEGNHSDEKRAAAAGLIMKNGAMGDIHKLINTTQDLPNTDGAAGGIRKQMMGDMNRTPFGMGAGDIANMKRGEKLYNPQKDAQGNAIKDASGNIVTNTDSPKNYTSMLQDRTKSKLSDSAWASLDPDDQIELTKLSPTLGDQELQNLVNATYQAESNPNISVKDEAKKMGATIRAAAAQRGITPERNQGSPSNETIVSWK